VWLRGMGGTMHIEIQARRAYDRGERSEPVVTAKRRAWVSEAKRRVTQLAPAAPSRRSIQSGDSTFLCSSSDCSGVVMATVLPCE
jgi:hypothetical protein